MQKLVVVLQQFAIVVEHAKKQTENDLLQLLKELSTALQGLRDGKSPSPPPNIQVTCINRRFQEGLSEAFWDSRFKLYLTWARSISSEN